MTANILVTSPYRPFTLPNKFSAVFNGYIYCGIVDKDPLVPSNQVQVYLVNESGDQVPVSQPLKTNAAGFLTYNGKPAKFVTDSNHSLLVQDSNKGQIWYEPDVASINPDTFAQYLSSNLGASSIGTSSGKTVQESLILLRESYGLLLSSFMSSANPLDDAIKRSRELNVSLVIDVDCSYDYLVVKSNDTIISTGEHTIKKNRGTKPNIQKSQMPERPQGVLSDFNVDAGIVIFHDNNAVATNIKIDGITISSDHHSEYGIYAPTISFSEIKNVKLKGFNKGIRCRDAYGNQFSRIFSLYYYSTTDIYSESYCYDFSDGEYASGTSNTLTNVTCTNYKRPFLFIRHNYSTLTNCGGEGVNSHQPSTPSDMPGVFEFIDCVSIVMNTPFTENLYGRFIRVTSSGDGPGRGASTVVVNGPQAITGIFGTTTDVGAKLFDASGGASVIVNGGVLTPAATGYFLELGGASDDAYFSVAGTDLRFCRESIQNTKSSTGINSIAGGEPVSVKRSGVVGEKAGLVEWRVTNHDPYLMASGSFIKIKLGGIYRVSIQLLITSATANSEIQLYVSPTASAGSGNIVQAVYPQAGDRQTITLTYEGRLRGGDFLYVSANNCNAKSNYDPDCVINASLK